MVFDYFRRSTTSCYTYDDRGATHGCSGEGSSTSPYRVAPMDR